MKHTISVLVENEFGVLARISGLFAGRGYNIQSLSVAETLDSHVSRITLTTGGNDAVIEQIMKQLNKLVNVIKVQDVTQENAVKRNYSLVKVGINPKTRSEILKTVELLSGEVLDVDNKCCIVEFRGDDEKIKTALNMLKPYGVIEFVQTGNVAMQRGRKVIA